MHKWEEGVTLPHLREDMEEEEGALVLEADMVAVAEIFLLAFLFVTFVVIAGQKILEGHSGSLVPLKIFTCLRTITLGEDISFNHEPHNFLVDQI